MSAPLIKLENVELTLSSDAGPVEILRGIDLAVNGGETLGIVGPSGSGKTSLLMIIAGLERATAGRVAVGGVSFEGLSEDALARLRGENIGIVFQDFHLIPNMTALENVALPLELADLDNPFERARASLDEVGLSHRHSHYPGQLSGGEQQRVALARALGPEPKLILADEPTGNLDGETGEKIMDLMFAVHDRKGTTLILVTHEDRLAVRCKRRVAMADGRIASDEHMTMAAD
ncbi:ATP-binding cassette domain-containing protein [Thalassospiraceae bacterium LMO-JJ14]|nr:ATP-binding cassette domain-containing protein [Thalassospiraceae bacterium LMO-JJ14]